MSTIFKLPNPTEKNNPPPKQNKIATKQNIPTRYRRTPCVQNQHIAIHKVISLAARVLSYRKTFPFAITSSKEPGYDRGNIERDAIRDPNGQETRDNVR